MHPNLESAAFIVSPTQVALDTAMLNYDIWGTRAHVLMLHKAGIIPSRQAAAICSALDAVEQGVQSGEFAIDPARGAQLSLERAVIEAAGVESGSRMHTAFARPAPSAQCTWRDAFVRLPSSKVNASASNAKATMTSMSV